MGNGRSEMSKAALHRRKDAGVLLAQHRFLGAMYLAGYAIECKLKAKLIYQLRVLTLEELEHKMGAALRIHNLEELASNLMGWKQALTQSKFKRNWSHVRVWSVTWRYDREVSDPAKAEKFIASVDEVLKWLENNV